MPFCLLLCLWFGKVNGMRRKKAISNKISYIKPVDFGILIAVFFMFVFLIVGMGIGTEKYKASQVLLVQDSMDILAENQKVQFEQYVDNKISLLQGLVTFPEIYEMDTQKQGEFIKNRSKALGFHHLFIMKADGMAYYIEENLCRNQKDEPFFYDVMENDVYNTEPFYGADATTMTISVSIFDKSREKVGALCGAIELKEIQEMFRENRMFMNGDSYLINRMGYYVSADDMNKVYNKITIYGESYTEVSLIKKAFEERTDQTGTIIHNGIEYQANVTYLKDFDWAIVQCVETEEIFKDLTYIDIWQYVSLTIVVIIILCVVRIIIYWHRSNRKINTDTLTGCSSRAAMQNLIEHLSSMKQYDISVIYLDLNRFKQINDTYGHDYGDKILCIFSDVLVETFGKDGYIGRIGGDEFMVVLLNTTQEEITGLCEKADERLKEKGRELEIDFPISTSYGFATRRRGSNEALNDIVNKADERMYDYKESHR